MLIIKIIGGLGNQLFQYNFSKLLQNEGHDTLLDVSWFRNYNLHEGYLLDRVFEDPLTKKNNTINHGFRKLITKTKFKLNGRLITDKNFQLDKINSKCYYFDGYWQSQNVLNQFNEIDKFKFLKANFKQIDNKGSICLHIRRGDYTLKENKKIYNQIGENYYAKALKYIKSKSPDLNQVDVYSDDLKAITELKKIKDFKFSFKSKDTLSDFISMTSYKFIITGNSTFSYWSAILSKDDSIVITPKKWFYSREEIYKPINWVKL